MKIKSPEFVNINGIEILKEKIDGYFTFEEALAYAKQRGLRLPTKQDLILLFEKGWWSHFENKAYLANSKQNIIDKIECIEFDFNGYLDPTLTPDCASYNIPQETEYGFYWTSDQKRNLIYSLIISSGSKYFISCDTWYKHSIFLIKQ